MKIAVFGTGMVGTTIATKLVSLGHEVSLGSRSADNEKGKAWLDQIQSPLATLAPFEHAAKGAELIFNATLGMKTLEALSAAGADNLKGKVLVDISNPLDFSGGMPPRLSVCNESSLGEEIQAAFPETKVVKTLNTVSCTVMVDPGLVPGTSTLFVSGNDPDAKRFVTEEVLKKWLGWSDILDLGDITTARGSEMYLPLWIRLWGNIKSPNFNVHVVRSQA